MAIRRKAAVTSPKTVIQKKPRTHYFNFEPRTETQKELAVFTQSKALTFAVGVAGTGKTTVLVAMAIKFVLEGQFDRIIITRPVVEATEQLGFLPGTFEEKLAPYLVPILEAVDKFIGKEARIDWMGTGKIQIVPIAYTRGVTHENAIVIVDESQNCSYSALKMILTRLGRNSKMFINGDLTQIDLKPVSNSGLATVIDALKDDPDVGYIKFTEIDCQRHPLVARIIKRLDVELPKFPINGHTNGKVVESLLLTHE